MAYTNIRDPRGIFDTHARGSASHVRRCPVCAGLLDYLHGAALEVDDLIGGPAAFVVPTRPGVRDTQPIPLRIVEQIRDPDRTQPPLPVAEPDGLEAAGFEIVQVPVRDDADASGKLRAIETARGVSW